MTAVELKEQLAKSWDEFRLLTTDESVELQMDPTDESEVKKNFFARLIPTSTLKNFLWLSSTRKTPKYPAGLMHMNLAVCICSRPLRIRYPQPATITPRKKMLTICLQKPSPTATT